MYYSYPKFSSGDLGIFRLTGCGLGNLLFSWARFLTATKQNELTPISPTWHQVRLGPLLRMRRDNKFDNGLFITPREQIAGWKKLYLLSVLPRISEEIYLSISEKEKRIQLTSNTNSLVIFKWDNDYFSRVLREHENIKNELLRITLRKHKRGLDYNFARSISVHVRLGDFRVPAKTGELRQGQQNCRIPQSWYAGVIRQLRADLGADLPVYIFSDGTEEELKELLAVPKSRVLSFGSNIADLLALSRANILITSGSTFSMWASYLGRMPVIWHPGQIRQRIYYENPEAEIEFYEGNFPDSFLTQVV